MLKDKNIILEPGKESTEGSSKEGLLDISRIVCEELRAAFRERVIENAGAPLCTLAWVLSWAQLGILVDNGVVDYISDIHLTLPFLMVTSYVGFEIVLHVLDDSYRSLDDRSQGVCSENILCSLEDAKEIFGEEIVSKYGDYEVLALLEAFTKHDLYFKYYRENECEIKDLLLSEEALDLYTECKKQYYDGFAFLVTFIAEKCHHQTVLEESLTVFRSNFL